MAQPAIEWVWSTQAISGRAMCTAFGIANPALWTWASQGSTLLPSASDFDQRRRSNLVEQETIGVDQELIVLPRYTGGYASAYQVRPPEQVDQAVARGKIKPGPPLRLAHARRGRSRSS
jgi:hypothetical protein